MQVRIENGPAFALARVALAPGESVRAEGGAMVSMSPTIGIETKAQGGFMKGLKRSMFGGESFFLNTFTADSGGEITFAPSLPGDIVPWELGGQTVLLTSGSFLAASTTVDLDTKWGGAKAFFSREGLFFLRVSGQGTVLVSSFGALVSHDLGPGEQLVIDSGHVVAFSETMRYEVRKLGSWKSTLLGGEGFVVYLTGPGRVTMQTRSPDAFVDWITPLLPFQRSGQTS